MKKERKIIIVFERKIIKYFFAICFLLSVGKINAQLNVSNVLTPVQLVDSILVGKGVDVSNITYSGTSLAIGSFSNGNTTNIGLDKGLLITTGSINNALGPNNSPAVSTNTSGGSDPQLAAMVPGNIVYDAAVLEFDFVPILDTLKLEYVFASEEYAEWLGANYKDNDVFGFFITGPNPLGGNYSNYNIAVVPNTANLPVTVNNVNFGQNNLGPCNNCAYYFDNTAGQTIQYDGFTTVLSSTLVLVPCSTYHVKIAIGDLNDHNYDSGVFLKSNSFNTNSVNTKVVYPNPMSVNSCVEGCSEDTIVFSVEHPSSFNQTIHYTIGGTAVNGVDYTHIPDSVTLLANSSSVNIVIHPIVDGIPEGVENIQLLVQRAACSIDTLNLSIEDYDPVSVSIIAPSDTCIGDSVLISSIVINGTPSYQYLWNNGDTMSSFITQINSTSTFSLIVSDFCGQSDTDMVVVTMNNLPNIIVSPNDTTICKGDTVVVIASGADTYQWSPNISLSSTTGVIVESSPDSTIIYTIVGTSSHGCVDSSVSIVNVKPLPTIVASATPNSICINDSASLLASGASFYIWSPSTSLNTNTGASVVAFPQVTTTYEVIGTDSNNCKNSDTVVLNVHQLPMVSISPVNPEICIGDTQILNVNGAQSFVWSPATFLNTTTGSSVISSATNSIDYVATGINNQGCENSDTISLVVNSLPIVTVYPHDSMICKGSSIVLVSTATTPVSYSWSPSSSLSSSTTDSVTATPLNSTSYIVTSIDSSGCSNTDTANVNLSPNPYISPWNSSVCIGDSIVLTVNTPISGTTSVWNTGDTTNSITVSPTAYTVYSVTTTTPMGCINVVQSSVSVSSKISLTVSSDTTICPNTSATLIANAPGASSYHWSPSSSLSLSTGSTVFSNPTINTSYTVIATTTVGSACNDTATVAVNIFPIPNVSVSPSNPHICPNDSVSLLAIGALTYSWSPSLGLSSSNDSLVIAKPNQNTIYQVVGVDSNLCYDTAYASVSIGPLLSIAPQNPNICSNDSVLLTVTSNTPASYQWNTGATLSSIWAAPISTATFSVVATDTAGCTNSDSVTVFIHQAPVLSITPPSPSLCIGDSVTITAAGASTYFWSPSTSINPSTGSVVSAFPTSTSPLVLIGYANGCNDTLSFQIVVNPLPIINVTSPDTICSGSSKNLIATGAHSYFWSWSPNTALDTTLNDTAIATPSSNTNYQVIGTDINGCKDTINTALAVYLEPSITASDSIVCTGDTTILTANCSINPISYLWSNGATTQSTAINPYFSSYYTVSVTYPNNCVKVDSFFINVFNDPKVVASAQSYSVFCPRDSVNLIGSNAVSYLWSPSSSLIDTVGTPVTALPPTTTIYTLIGTSIHGCKSVDTVGITVISQQLNVNILASPSIICVGDSAILLGDGAATYSWNPTSGVTSTTGDTMFVNPLITTSYVAIGTDVYGCIDRDTVVLIVDQGPVLNVTPAYPVVCKGDSTTLVATGAATYVWSPNFSITSTNSPIVEVYPPVDTTYTLVGTDTNGCVSDTTVYILVKRSLVLWATPELDSVCLGDSIKIIVNGAGVDSIYLWNPTNSLTYNTPIWDTVFAKPTSTTTYYITGISTDGCSKTTSSLIKVHPKPLMNISASPPNICMFDSVKLFVTGADSFLWESSNSIYGNWGDSIAANPIVTTDYKVVGTTDYGCVDSISQQVVVNPLPQVQAIAIDSSICIHDSTQLVALGSLSFAWEPTSIVNPSVGSNVFASPLINSSIILIGTDANNCVNYDTIDIVVHSRPQLSAQATDTLICAFDTITLTSQSLVNPILFVWNTGDTTNSITVTPGVDTVYQVNGFNGYGCDDSVMIAIQANPYPQLSLNTTDTIICDYDSVSLISMSTVNPVDYLWSNNKTTSSIVVQPVVMTTYTLIAADSIGCSDTISTTVRVQSRPTVSISSSNNPSCSGDTTTLSSVASSSVASYLWSNMATQSSTIVTTQVATLYTLIVTDSIGCQNSDSIMQFVFPSPVVIANSSVSQICVGDSVELTVSSAVNPIAYLWSNGITNDSLYVSPFLTTDYYVSGTDSAGCIGKDTVSIVVNNLPVISFTPANAEICIGDTITILANSNPVAATYNWSTGSTTQGISVNPLINTSYMVNITDVNNCTDSAFKSIIVHSLPNVSINPDSSIICDGDALLLTANTSYPVPTYNWSNGQSSNPIQVYPSLTQTYWVVAIDSNNCKSSDTAFVEVLPRPTCTITAIDDTICSIDSTMIVYSGSGKTTSIYQWFLDSGNLLSGSGKDPHWLSWNTAGYYHVSLLVTENGCTSYPDTANVLVYLTPTVDFTVLPDELCAGLPVSFTNNTSNIGSFMWNFGNPLDNKDTSSSANASYIYPNSGLYSIDLNVVSNDGCPSYGSFSFVNVHPNPIASFDANPTHILTTDPFAHFTDHSIDAVSWLYDFDDPKSGADNISVNKDNWHEFADTGLFRVSLVVESNFGCTDTAWHSVRVKSDPQIYFPNAFTPNNDGLNDVFEVKGNYVDWSTYEIYIYDRWGKQVFESHDINKSWNGKIHNSGATCPIDVYSVIIKVRSVNGKMKIYHDSITIIL